MIQVTIGTSNAEVSDDGHVVQLAPQAGAPKALVLAFLQAPRSSASSRDVTTAAPSEATAALSILKGVDGPAGLSLIFCMAIAAIALTRFFRLSVPNESRSSALDQELDYAAFMKRYGGKTR